MGVDGGSAPYGLSRRSASTLFLRAPSTDWPALMRGAKTEFRIPYRGAVPSSSLQVPTPVVLYAVSSRDHIKTKLMMLVDHSVERLFDLSEKPDSLMREGMESYDHFRTYWRRRTRRPWRPLRRVEAFQVAPWPTSQLAVDQLGRLLIQRLYGEFIDDARD